MNDAMTRHSDSESLAAFVDGRLGREELEVVSKHLQTCEECQGLVREAATFAQEEAATQRPRRTWWVAAAAVAVVVLAVAPFMRGFLHRRELEKDTQQLFAAIGNAKERKIQARFSGQVTYARWSPKRGSGGEEKSPEEFRVEGDSAELAIAAQEDLSPAGRRAAALAEAVSGDRKKALEILKGIPKEARTAAIWNDLAVVTSAIAQGDDEKQYLQDALTAVEEAHRLDPKMLEALFNRAVILQRLGNPGAAAAWQEYLAIDPQGRWADEAKDKMNEPAPLQ